jgi:hypothetical protein
MLPTTAAYAATGSMDIDGTTGVSLATDQSGTGWTWTAASATLTLNSSYTGEAIKINCASTETVNLVYTGNVTVASSSATASALTCDGWLNISGSGGTLSLSYTGGGYFGALTVNGDLIVNSGTVNAESSGTSDASRIAAAIRTYGLLTISGAASVTAQVTGANANGIASENNIVISTSGTVTANSTGSGYALYTPAWGSSVAISGGTVALTGSPANGPVSISGAMVTAKAADNTSLYLVTLSGKGPGEYVQTVTAPAGYNFSRLRHDSSGNLFFWLPAGPQTVTLETMSKTYTTTLTVATDHTTNTATLTPTSKTAISIAAIGGITPPAAGATPVTAVTETAQYTGVVISWKYGYNFLSSLSGTATFAPNTAYRAIILLTPKAGYTLINVAVNFFTVAGATTTYPISTEYAPSYIEATFPATGGGAPGSTVTGVTVSPATVEVQKGGTQLFSATVNGAGNPAQTVTWSVSGGTGTTNISSGGLLTVDANETATTLTVRATSDVDNTKYVEATVTLIPVITVHPQADMYAQGHRTAALTVTATSPDGGTLTFQWYRNLTDSNTGGIPIPGATESSYTPPTSEEGIVYYYAIVTNTLGGTVTGIFTSDPAGITVMIPPLPIIARRVTLDVSPHFLSDPPAGVSYVQSGRDLYITLTPKATLPAGHTPQVKTSRTTDEGGVTVTRNAAGAWTVRIVRIQQAVTVTITAAGASTSAAESVSLAQVWSHGHRLYIAASTSGEAYIYNVSGIRVKTVAVVAGATVSETLPAGVYIVALEGRRYKVAVK